MVAQSFARFRQRDFYGAVRVLLNGGSSATSSTEPAQIDTGHAAAAAGAAAVGAADAVELLVETLQPSVAERYQEQHRAPLRCNLACLLLLLNKPGLAHALLSQLSTSRVFPASDGAAVASSGDSGIAGAEASINSVELEGGEFNPTSVSASYPLSLTRSIAPEVAYNTALSLLAVGNSPFEAFLCLQQAVEALADLPQLWVRLAESCIQHECKLQDAFHCTSAATSAPTSASPSAAVAAEGAARATEQPAAGAGAGASMPALSAHLLSSGRSRRLHIRYLQQQHKCPYPLLKVVFITVCLSLYAYCVLLITVLVAVRLQVRGWHPGA